MRRGLAPTDLGDLFDQPRAAVISMSLPDGRIFSRPVWHRFRRRSVRVPVPGRRSEDPDPEIGSRATVVLAEGTHPYRAIEVRGRVRMTRDGYHDIGLRICRPYVEAYDPTTDPPAYMSVGPGIIAKLEPDVTTCWDYADDAMMPPSEARV